MIQKIIGCALEGIESHKAEVEVNISRGAKFFLVGLLDNAVKESHFRIVAALKNIGYKIPVKEIMINLAPADLKNKGVLSTCLLPQEFYVHLNRFQKDFLKIMWLWESFHSMEN